MIRYNDPWGFDSDREKRFQDQESEDVGGAPIGGSFGFGTPQPATPPANTGKPGVTNTDGVGWEDPGQRDTGANDGDPSPWEPGQRPGTGGFDTGNVPGIITPPTGGGPTITPPPTFNPTPTTPVVPPGGIPGPTVHPPQTITKDDIKNPTEQGPATPPPAQPAPTAGPGTKPYTPSQPASSPQPPQQSNNVWNTLNEWLTKHGNQPSRYDADLVKQGASVIEESIRRMREQGQRNLGEHFASRGLTGSSLEGMGMAELEGELGRSTNERMFNLQRDQANTWAQDRGGMFGFGSNLGAMEQSRNRAGVADDQWNRRFGFDQDQSRIDQMARLAEIFGPEVLAQLGM